MKLVSIEHLVEEALSAFKRFPLAISCSMLATITAILLVDNAKDDISRLYINILMTLSLGMVTYVGLAAFAQRYTMRKSTVIAFHVAVAAIMVYYYFAQPDEFTVKSVARYIILLLAVHLGVSFAPYMVDTEMNGFWQFNKSLFLRFLTSVLYSLVLFVGLSLALVTIDNLFNVSIDIVWYQRLFITIFGTFNTWFFLAGMPERIIKLQLDTDYPKSLRVFTQFVLLPLVTIYLLILYAYAAKIAFTFVWPRGYVSYLVIGFSTLGILALLLVWPLRSNEKYKWIHTYTKWFFIAVFPLIVLLGMAIGRRVIEYGVTENRYFVIILSLWLFINALYFLFSERKNIKFIPMSLFFTALISGFGPWNAFQISQESQLNRLENLLEKNHLLKDGFVQRSAKDSAAISVNDRIEVSSIVDYLTDAHGVESMQQFFKSNLVVEVNKTVKSENRLDKKVLIVQMLGIDYLYQNSTEVDLEYKRYNYSAKYSNVLNISEYDYYFPIDLYVSDNQAPIVFDLDSSKVTFDYEKGSSTLKIWSNNEPYYKLALKDIIRPIEKTYGRNNYNIDQYKLTTSFQDGNGRTFKIILRGISGNINEEDTTKFNLSSLNGIVLIKK
jgi:hypothetical protein